MIERNRSRIDIDVLGKCFSSSTDPIIEKFIGRDISDFENLERNSLRAQKIEDISIFFILNLEIRRLSWHKCRARKREENISSHEKLISSF